jgi:predicted transcriptional regulator
LVVCDEKNKALGILPASELMTRLTKKKVVLTDTIEKIYLQKFRQVSDNMPVSELARILGRYAQAVVHSANGKPRAVSSSDLVNFISPSENST